MKRILKNLIILIILAGLAYQFRAPLSAHFLPLWDNFIHLVFPNTPCEEPIPYTLGFFDTKFNISKEYFLKALTEAEAIWEKPKGTSLQKDLFAYEPANSSRDVLKVNLIYDYRQQATAKLASLGIEVENTRASYDSLKVKFTTLKAQYEKDKAEFEVKLAAWNRSPRTNKNEFNELQAMQKNLNEKADEINALVVALNRLVTVLNLSVEKYNTTNDARGESFEEGVYHSEGVNREIDVYEFSNRQKLVRVLAHELGHALGLEHLDDPKAMMYELNQGNIMTLTATDLTALKTKCGIGVD